MSKSKRAAKRKLAAPTPPPIRRSAVQRAEHWLHAHPSITLLGTLALCAVLLVTRRPDVLFHPQFWAEDGAVWYTDGYTSGLIHPLFRTYSGYFAFIHRIVAGLSVLLPFHLAPLFFNVIGMGFLLLPVALIASQRFRRIIPYSLLAIAISVLYVGALNNDEIFGNLANIQWPLAILAFLVVVAEPAKRRAWRIFDIAALAAAGMAGPAVIILTPLAAYVWWRSRERQHLVNAAVLAGVALVQILAILFFSHYQRIGAQADANWPDFVRMIVGQVFMGGTLGLKYVNAYYGNFHLLEFLLALGTGLIVYAVVKGPLWLKLINVFWPLMVVSMLYSQIAVPGLNVWHGLTNPFGGQRYWFVPIVSCVATIIWLALAAPNKIMRGAGCVLLGLLLVVGLPQGWRIAPLPNLHFQAYARKFESLPKGTKYTLPINPGWKMTLYKK